MKKSVRRQYRVKSIEWLTNKGIDVPVGIQPKDLHALLVEHSAPSNFKLGVLLTADKQAHHAEVNRRRAREKQIKKKRAENPLVLAEEFFTSDRWRKLRYMVLRQYGRNCMCCGALGSPPHVDHIKPRSKYPELQWDFDNLQVLCEACNMGKRAWDETDWRPKIGVHHPPVGERR